MVQQLTPNVSIHTSHLWQTNSGIVRRGYATMLVDPAMFPPELAQIAQAVEGTRVIAGFVTHAHWDHILWDPAFGSAPRYASRTTADLLGQTADKLTRQLDDAEAGFAAQTGMNATWDHSQFFDVTPHDAGLEVLADERIEFIDVSGHCDGQTAIRFVDDGVCFVADTLSDIEVPSFDGGRVAVDQYLASLDRLRSVIDRTPIIVPGHGSVADQKEARRRLELDRRYLIYLPAAVGRAAADISDEELARHILHNLDERRADDGLAWEMHLHNVQQLRESQVE